MIGNRERINQLHYTYIFISNVIIRIQYFYVFVILISGSALMNIVGVYKDIQDQHMNIVSIYYVQQYSTIREYLDVSEAENI